MYHKKVFHGAQDEADLRYEGKRLENAYSSLNIVKIN